MCVFTNFFVIDEPARRFLPKSAYEISSIVAAHLPPPPPLPDINKGGPMNRYYVTFPATVAGEGVALHGGGGQAGERIPPNVGGEAEGFLRFCRSITLYR